MSGDDRFNAMHTAAIFKQSKKDNFKVKVDDRFKTLLSDERFQSAPGKVDKYGRKIKNKDSVKKVAEEMKEFYDIETEEAEDKQENEKSKQPKAKSGSSGQGMDSRLDYLNKLARGEVSDEESSSSGSEESDSESESDDEDSEDNETERSKSAGKSTKSALDIPEQLEPEFSTDISSNRIAIQNCDWENVSAEDIMVVLQSFCPTGSASSVRKVTVYVSDFGKKRMEIESKYGPQGIWKEQEREEEEDENNEDLYDYIAAVDEDGNAIEEESDGEDSESADSASHSEESDSEASESVEEDSESENNQTQNKKTLPQSKKALKGADFMRRGGAVGLVMHDDLKSRGISSKYRSQSDDEEEEEENSAESEDDEEGNYQGNNSNSNGEKKKKAGKPLKDGEGFDDVALRKYELSKLRYYFAVAECDSVRTANMLYEELDGVEMESTSMVFDLSLVPNDLSFSDREIRDTYSLSASGVVNPNYKPPDFVVNALQHTKVQCSWDEGEKLRERQLSNFSSWRNLNESELQQYVANSSSDSDNTDDSESDDENEKIMNNNTITKKQQQKSNDNKKISKKKQDKAALMRKMLLGDDAASQENSEEEDDFFENNEEKERNSEDDEEDNSMYEDGSEGEIPEGFSDMEDGDDEDNENEGKTLTYMPELGKELLAKKRNNTTETPYEIEQRKMAEKKKARKLAKKEYQEKLENEKKLAVSNATKKGKNNKNTTSSSSNNDDEEDRKKRAELELLFDDNTKDDYDMRQIIQNEKEKLRSKKSKRRKGNNTTDATNDDFKLDMNDSRFSKLFEGDSRYGIDKTSNEFRLTSATKDILSEQVKRRQQKDKKGLNQSTVRTKDDNNIDTAAAVDVNNLVNKLKRKYNKT